MESYNGILQLNRNTTDRDSGIKKSVEPRYPLTFTIINIAGQSFGHIPRFDACRYLSLSCTSKMDFLKLESFYRFPIEKQIKK